MREERLTKQPNKLRIPVQLTGLSMIVLPYVMAHRHYGWLVPEKLEWLLLACFAPPVGLVLLVGGRWNRNGGCFALLFGFVTPCHCNDHRRKECVA